MNGENGDGRIIGIRHRVKKTRRGEPRPTQVAILREKRKPKTYLFRDDTAELDWVREGYPVKYKPPTEHDDLNQFRSHHITWRRLKEDEDPQSFPQNLVRQVGKHWELATRIPVEFDGLQPGDTVAMILGGSGDRLAYALSRKADTIGATILRIPPFVLKKQREAMRREIDDDAITLAELARDKPEFFYPVTPRDRKMIKLAFSFALLSDTMKDRIKCEQRLFQRTHGQIFLSEEGGYPEGTIEDAYRARKANDARLKLHLDEEKERERELAKAVGTTDVYQEVFVPIKGIGPRIAGRIIPIIGDIRRFPTPAKLKAYCGLHVRKGGKYEDVPPEQQFPRKRRGETANWREILRQAFYIFVSLQLNRPQYEETEWGKKFREYKKTFRERHPRVIKVKKQDPETGEMREVGIYTNAHIHRMAIWRTATKAAEYVWREWWRLERRQRPGAAE